MVIATMPITELRRRTGEVLLRVKREPIIVTCRGRPEVIVIDYDAYREMAAKLEELERIKEQDKPPAIPIRTGVKTLIKEMQAKYAKYPSFNEALLTERAREREREKRRLRA